ncbi:MAG: PEGA domain-containing protein [Bdellovibrionales bacterium]|nr:PEGA domain-containing protein [Bdellovibrionales bacterium]
MTALRFHIFFSLLTVSAFVFAQSQPMLIVSPMEGTQSNAAVKAIVSELQKSNKVGLVSDQEVLNFANQYSTNQKPTSSKEAYEFFQQGKLAYQNLDIENSVDYFRKAERLYKDTLWDEESFNAYRTTKFQLAQSFLALNRYDEAQIQMNEVMLLDPDRNEKKLSSKFYSPQVRKLYQDVFEEFQNKEKGDVILQSDPQGASVFLDGKKIGVTPASIKNIPVGKHYFRFTKNGFEDHFNEQFIVVGENRIESRLQSSSLTSKDAYFTTLDPSQTIEENRRAFLDELGLALGGDIFLFLTPLSGKVQGQLYDQRSQELSPQIQGKTPAELVEKLLRFLGPDGYVVSRDDVSQSALVQKDNIEIPNEKPELSTTAPKQPSTSSENKITKKWWFWPAVGVVVIGAGAGMYAGGVFDQGVSSSTLVTEIP